MDSNNEYLYHYTNLDSLALILKNRTIRFMPLTVMDDIQESKFKDESNVGQYCFISCWTDELDDSLPMWSRYTDDEQGVRIKLRKYPFETYEIDATSLGKAIKSNVTIEKGLKLLFPQSEITNPKYYSPSIIPDKVLFKIEYTDDLNFLVPHVISPDGSLSIDYKKIGRYKNTKWIFQNEWRYIIIFNPVSFSSVSSGNLIDGSINLINALNNNKPLPFEFYDLKIDVGAFNDMEIMLSPKMTAGNRVIADLLLKNYNPKASIVKSSIDGYLR